MNNQLNSVDKNVNFGVRPTIITAMCFLLFVANSYNVLIMPFYFNIIVQKLSTGFAILNLLNILASFYSTYKIWRMEKQGVHIFIVTTLFTSLFNGLMTQNIGYLFPLGGLGVFGLLYKSYDIMLDDNDVNTENSANQNRTLGFYVYKGLVVLIVSCICLCMCSALLNLFTK
jgi:hypothetical protein